MNKSILLALLINLLCITRGDAKALPECLIDKPINGKLTLAPKFNNQIPELIDEAQNIYKLADIYSPPELPQKLIQQRTDLIIEFIDNQTSFQRNKIGFSDRYKRQIHHIFGKNTTDWLQAKLISAGLAYVAPNSQSLSCIDKLLALEKTAQQQKQGLWAVPKFRIMGTKATALLQKKATFQLIRGKILSTGQTKTTVYLNFGGLWKEDFTVKIPKRVFKNYHFWEKLENQNGTSTISADYLKNKTVVIRGWVLENDGPLIELTHSKQMQIEY